MCIRDSLYDRAVELVDKGVPVSAMAEAGLFDKLGAKCSAVVFEDKLTRKRPLIVEMPDRHSDSNPGDSIKRC